MCGFAGIVGRSGIDPERGEALRRMTATIIHRGPDGAGYRAMDGCDLGFRRLAIMHPDAPALPFTSEDGAITSVCNGEIYNAAELRNRLTALGHVFNTRVDTEVIPHLYEEVGADLAGELDGMFAFAIWDQRGRALTLGRDRAGEKPLFYWRDERQFVFASELRAILAHGGVPVAVDPVALRRYLLHDYFPAPMTPILGVRKLPAAHVMVVRAGEARLKRYWDLADHFKTESDGARRKPADVAAELDEKISAAVRRRRSSDVPVGVFLSGGLDSSLILAHLSEQTGAGVPVFSLGHGDISFDEARFARRTARHFGAAYHEMILTESDLEEGLRRIGENLDEPLGDASTIPMSLLAGFARRHVKVILTGEGSDELFAGYPTYAGSRLADLYQKLPAGVRRVMAHALRRVTPVTMGNVGVDYLVARFLEGAARRGVERHHSWFGSLPPDQHPRILSPRLMEMLVVDDPFASARAVLAGKRFPDALAEMLYTDFTMYLQDGLLTKVDRTTMLSSLEARAPFLDHRLAEFAAGLPSGLKLRRGRTKAILRLSARNRLPREVVGRRKRGFNVPFSKWLLHGLGARLRERFSPERVRARGLLSSAGITSMLDDHLAGRADHRKPLFTLLALDLWCDQVFGAGASVAVSEIEVPRLAEALAG